MKELNKVYKIEAELDLTKEPSEIKVRPVVGDPFGDLGFWLEVTGFMAHNAMKYKEWNKKQMMEHIVDSFSQTLDDYQIKK